MPVLLLSNTLPDAKNPEREFFASIGRQVRSVGYFPSRSDPARKYFHVAQEHFLEFQVNHWVYADLDEEYEPTLVEDAFRCDLIYLSGGVTPYFLKNIRARRVDSRIVSFLDNGGALVGVSAGAILMGPSLEIGFDDPIEQDAARDLKDIRGLGIYSFEFFPHFSSDSNQVSYIRSRFENTKTPIAACPDGAGVIVEKGAIRTIGPVQWIKN